MYSVTTVDSLRSFVGKSGNDLDYWFADEIVSATSTLQSYVGWTLVRSQQQIIFSPDDIDTNFLLPAREVAAIVSIESRNNYSVNDSDWTVIPSTLYQLRKKIYGTQYVFYSNAFLCGLSYRITFTAGFQVVPPDVRLCANIIGAIDYMNSFLSGGDKFIMLKNIARNFSQGSSASDAVKDIDDLEYQWQQRAKKYRISPV